MRKLPYIPDKRLYAAVMGACSYVRETGYFNKATQYYADKYDVDVDEVRRYVRMAQGNGQREAAKQSKKTYRWYVAIVMNDWYCAGDEGYYSSFEWNDDEKFDHCEIVVKRALSKKNAVSAITDTGLSVYADIDTPHEERCVLSIVGYATRKEAEDAASAITEADIRIAIKSH